MLVLRISVILLELHHVSKKSHLRLAITLTHMNGFWYFLAECHKVGNQKTLYYAALDNLCKNEETRKSHFDSVGLLHTQYTCALSS